jgi:hypothetical protein
MQVARRMRFALVCAAAVGAAAPVLASASVTDEEPIRFVGGTSAARAQVVRALEASDFEWGRVRDDVTVHIGRFETSATPGHVWLDEDLLRAGRFSWGVILHEYAHQVDFLLLDDSDRRVLAAELGGERWCLGADDLPHGSYTCERLASTLAWSYWPSPANVMRPSGPRDESAAMARRAFRRLLDRVLRRRRRARPRPCRCA